MSMQHVPWNTGFAVSVTMAISYSVCLLLYTQWSQTGITFLNARLHGPDFGRLATTEPLTFQSFLLPLLVLSLWRGLLGTLLSWRHQRRHRNC